MDQRAADNSCVLNIDRLDEEHRINFQEDKPWIFETDGDLHTYATEEEACAAQRAYRIRCGFHPITGLVIN